MIRGERIRKKGRKGKEKLIGRAIGKGVEVGGFCTLVGRLIRVGRCA